MSFGRVTLSWRVDRMVRPLCVQSYLILFLCDDKRRGVSVIIRCNFTRRETRRPHRAKCYRDGRPDVFAQIMAALPASARAIVWLNALHGRVEADGKDFEEMAVYRKYQDRIAGIVPLAATIEGGAAQADAAQARLWAVCAAGIAGVLAAGLVLYQAMPLLVRIF